MSKERLHHKHWQFQDLVLVLVVIAAYVSTFALTDRPFSFIEIIVMLFLGVIFLLMDLLWIDELYQWNARWSPYFYFIVQVPIAGAMIYLSSGNAWLILMPLAAQSVISFNWRGVLALNLVFIGMLLANILLITNNWRMIGQGIVAFQTAFFFVIAFTQIMLREQRSRKEVQKLADQLGEANRQLREYALKIEELASSQERNRLAREIHDGLGHYLTAVNMQIRAAIAIMEKNPQQAKEALEKAGSLAQEALADVRRSVAALRSTPTLSRPLPETLEALIEESRAAGLVGEMKVIGTPRQLSAQSDLTLFRAAQEGLTNIHKHALASKVQLSLEYSMESVKLSIIDNGIGTLNKAGETETSSGGFGLFGLRERVQLLGGVMMIHSGPNQGFCLEIEIGDKGA
jgi:signal transduction histidine kinase